MIYDTEIKVTKSRMTDNANINIHIFGENKISTVKTITRLLELSMFLGFWPKLEYSICMSVRFIQKMSTISFRDFE